MGKGSLFRPLTLAIAMVAGLGSMVEPAFAASARTHHRYNEFYALAPSESDQSAVTRHVGDCFQSNSAVEATRGIRHWTGACAGSR
jgi:hypothetical protein